MFWGKTHFFLKNVIIFRDAFEQAYPKDIYLFKVSNRDNRKRCEICSKLAIKVSKPRS